MKRFMWWHVYVLRHKVTSDITNQRLVNMCWDCPTFWRYEPRDRDVIGYHDRRI